MAATNYNVEIRENGKSIVIEMNCNERVEYELNLLSAMSDEEVYSIYNVDNRQDAEAGIVEYFTYIH